MTNLKTRLQNIFFLTFLCLERVTYLTLCFRLSALKSVCKIFDYEHVGVYTRWNLAKNIKHIILDSDPCFIILTPNDILPQKLDFDCKIWLFVKIKFILAA